MFKSTLIVYMLLLSCIIVGCVDKSSPMLGSATSTVLSPTLMSTKTQPSPTLSSLSAKEFLSSVLRDNGGCKLPCIWGISPGKTELSTLKNLLISFGNNEIPNNYYSTTSFHENLGGMGIGVWDNNVRVSYRLDYRGSNNIEYINLSAEVYREKGDGVDRSAVLEIGAPQLTQGFSYYTLQNILAFYGKPSQIILAPYPDASDHPALWVPFSLVLFYEQQGILAEYIVPKNTSGDSYEFCPSQMAHISILTWQPDNNLSLDDIVKSYTGYTLNSTTIDYFKPIEDTTTLTIADFTNFYRVSGKHDCLRTSINFWPKQ